MTSVPRDLGSCWADEARLVVLCAANPSSARARLVREILPSIRDWAMVARIATAHSVRPQIFGCLTKECAELVPEQIRVEFARQLNQISLRNQHLSRELVRLAGLLEQAGIAVLTLKGPVLAAMSHGSVTRREFADLDLVVSPDDLERAGAILSREGYLPHLKSGAGLSGGRFQEFEICFRDPKKIGAIDLHWRLIPRAFPYAPDDRAVWQRARRQPLEGGEVTTPSPDDTMLYLCAHGAKHGFRMLGWVCDIAAMLDGPNAADLDAVLDQSRLVGSHRMVLLALALAHDLLAALIPDRIAERWARDRAIAPLTARVKAAMFRDLDHGEIEPWVVPLMTIETLHGRARYLTRRLLAPTMGDFELLPLPRALFPLYWLIRPFRVALQWGPRLIRGVRTNALRGEAQPR